LTQNIFDIVFLNKGYKWSLLKDILPTKM